jgi:hypothetical protein
LLQKTLDPADRCAGPHWKGLEAYLSAGFSATPAFSPNSDIEKWETSDREDLETFCEQNPHLFWDYLLSQ